MEVSTIERDKADATIAVCRCGGMVIAAVTAPLDTDSRRSLMEAAINGCNLKHVEVQEARKLPWGCKCPLPEPGPVPQDDQLDLFGKAA